MLGPGGVGEEGGEAVWIAAELGPSFVNLGLASVGRRAL